MTLHMSFQAIMTKELLSTCEAAEVGLSWRFIAEVRKLVSLHVA